MQSKIEKCLFGTLYSIPVFPNLVLREAQTVHVFASSFPGAEVHTVWVGNMERLGVPEDWVRKHCYILISLVIFLHIPTNMDHD